MKKLVSMVLALAMILTLGASTVVSAAEQTVLYKVTPVKDYKATEGRYVDFTDVNKQVGYGDWQEYIRVDRNASMTARGVDLTAVDLTRVKAIKSKSLSTGMYLVNYEVKPGKYKLTGDGSAVMLKDATLDRNNDFIQNTAITVDKGETQYIIVKKEQFALYLLGDIKATIVK